MAENEVPNLSDAERKAKLARAFALVNGAIPKRPPPPVAKPLPPLPRVAERVVEVAPKDRNYTPENGGRVKVHIYDELYWSAVDAAFARPRFAEVVSSYNPFSPERMKPDAPEDR
jgi:hypothetical protein